MIRRIKSGIGDIGVRLIKWTARKLKIDLIQLGYSTNGLLRSENLTVSGERYFITQYLPQLVLNDQPVLVDIGANIGDYSKLLRQAFPNATIISAEPNPATFSALQKNSDPKNILIQKGLGAKEEQLPLYFDAENETSVQASSDPEVLTLIAKQNNLKAETISITTLDQLCAEHEIETIDLLKIDTEGFELEVLMGAKKLLEENKIKVIQFEFNEVNIVKRRFLNDFYKLLPNYDFYRLDKNRLIELGEWSPKHEIFRFQNIAAILR